MLVVNLDGQKQNNSVGNWFEIHEIEKNNFTRLIWIERWHMEVQASVSYACKLRSMILGSENDRNRYRR
jgi:hypothetical protein